MDDIVFDEQLTKADRLVLKALAEDLRDQSTSEKCEYYSRAVDTICLVHRRRKRRFTQRTDCGLGTTSSQDEAVIATLSALNDPKDAQFEPTVFNGIDYDSIRLPKLLDGWLLRPYIRIARSVVRYETDVVMLNHLLLYLATSVPSAVFLFWRFSWLHGLLHLVMQFTYMGPYTLMMHQHIHQRGILAKRFRLIDTLFPYITDPLMGHTWNSYFYHHIKHHHVEGNGPDDLSSTIRYQRDDIFHFLHYFGRFLLLIWLELPRYFARKGRVSLALKAGFWEGASYAMMYCLWRVNSWAALCTVLLPFILMRIGLMVGNWGQHAFVDDEEPDSDYRSSITLIDVAVRPHS
jgi:hypothetical protein